MPRYALGLEYDGTDYFGWQTQHQEPTLQATLERAVGFVANAPVSVVAGGRTDTGVHAEGQVVHFECAAERCERAWVLGVNSRLPDSIAVSWARAVADDFHARFSARRRWYRYRMIRRPTRPALALRYASWIRDPLDLPAMRSGAQALLGEHDFSSYRTVACQAASPVRRIDRLELVEDGEFLDVHIEANAFLHHMVRNIVGSLLLVGKGEREAAWIGAALAARDRRAAGPTAPAGGLTFMRVYYPSAHGLPVEHVLPEEALRR